MDEKTGTGRLMNSQQAWDQVQRFSSEVEAGTGGAGDGGCRGRRHRNRRGGALLGQSPSSWGPPPGTAQAGG